MIKNKGEIFEILISTDDYGNPIETKQKTGVFYCDFVLPVSFEEVQKLYGNNTKISFKTFTRSNRKYNEQFEISGNVYRIEKIMKFPNGVNELFLEVIK